ncbi:MAG: ribonuclease HIII [Myxococcota bacterium]|nr:ribonuclease HIII [Myxococcota bacterium]
MSVRSFTIKLNLDDEPSVKRFFADHGFEFRDLNHGFWQARGPGCNASFYRSGKLLIQGKEAEVYRGLLGDVTADARPYHRALTRHPQPAPKTWLGTDEAGKGDYFGPLVVAGAVVYREQLELMVELGVDDSKAISDAKIFEIEAAIKHVCPHEVLFIGPEKYNELYERMGNLNRLLTWCHCKVIENQLSANQTRPIEWVLVDQFVKEAPFRRGLGQLGAQVPLALWPKAESDPAVAAASVLARAAYLRGVERLSQRFGVRLRPGAGQPTLQAGREFLSQHGLDALKLVAKYHFDTTRQLTRSDGV